MAVEVFYIPESTPDQTQGFIRAFINSSDFTNAERLAISRQLSIAPSDVTEKDTLSDYLANYFFNLRTNEFQTLSRHLLRKLILRSKTYMGVKLGGTAQHPQLADPSQIIHSLGEAGWYGPITLPEESKVSWYIRTTIFPFIRTDFHEDVGAQKVRYFVRWLCFARVAEDNVSMFWRNFTTGGKDGGNLYLKENEPFVGRFPYWNYIPGYFRELSEILSVRLEDLPLETIILHNMWDDLRYQEGVHWADERIRAEHQGVSLNASDTFATVYTNSHSEDADAEEADQEDADGSTLDISGIRYLASTIRTKVQMRLQEKYSFHLPTEDEEYFDEEILRTLIQQYNPKSYRCSVRSKTDNDGSLLMFRADSYFGKVPESSSADKFIHLYLKSVREISHLEQLKFLLRYVNSSNSV